LKNTNFEIKRLKKENSVLRKRNKAENAVNIDVKRNDRFFKVIHSKTFVKH